MMKAIHPSCFEWTFPNHIQFLIVYFLLFLLLIMSSLKSGYLLFFASTPVAISPGQTPHLKEILPFPSAIIPLLNSYSPAPIILKQTPSQRNKTGCVRSACLKNLLYYTGSTYIHILFLKILFILVYGFSSCVLVVKGST